ncbi:MAG: RHS repeat-associated core domain-containing protein [Armatimonadota bacterium]
MTDWTGTWSYGYDENNRLASATSPNPVPEQPCGGDYGYDWVGNRLNPPTGTNHMVYNTADQLTSWPGMYSYSYYNDGSLMEVRNAQDAFISSYTYHPNGLLNQATYVTAQGNHTAVNTWDTNSNRVGLEINGGTYSFVHDIRAGMPAIIEENKTGGTPVYYYREPGGSLIARYDSTNGWRYYHFDALGSTRLITDGRTGANLGNPTDKYSYDAYGGLIWHERLEGSIDQPYQYVGQLGYYTHYQDPDFKLLQLGVRYYDNEIGRFTQKDSIYDDTMSLYVYANSSPQSWVDADGRSAEKPKAKKPPKTTIENPVFGWDIIDDAIDQSACEDVIEHIGREKLRIIVRCIIWGESYPKDSMNSKRCGTSAGTCYGLMQLGYPNGVGADCEKNWRKDYPDWRTDASDNVGCGTRALCNALKKHNYNTLDPAIKDRLYTSIQGDEYKECRETLEGKKE